MDEARRPPGPAGEPDAEPLSKKPVVILIEDEPEIRRFLRASLIGHGYRLFEATTGAEGLREAESRQPDIVVLDLGLPDIDGLEVIRRLREWTGVPIIVLSARGQEQDKIIALDAGADDYVGKPFGVGELLARLRVSLRHAERTVREAGEPTFSAGDLEVNPTERRVLVGGNEIHLTPIEYRLLATMVKHAGKVLTHRQLLREVWGPPYAEQAHYLHVYMAQLRRKIETDPARPRHLLTEPGIGYRLAAD
jgi:two-component system KDP operon response regulator KdpE